MEINALCVERKLCESRIRGVEHPCYVQGELASCQTYYDRYLAYYICRECKKVIFSTFEYSDLYHEYSHN